VVTVFIVVAPVDTAHRHHLAGTEMLSDMAADLKLRTGQPNYSPCTTST